MCRRPRRMRCRRLPDLCRLLPGPEHQACLCLVVCLPLTMMRLINRRGLGGIDVDARGHRSATDVIGGITRGEGSAQGLIVVGAENGSRAGSVSERARCVGRGIQLGRRQSCVPYVMSAGLVQLNCGVYLSTLMLAAHCSATDIIRCVGRCERCAQGLAVSGLSLVPAGGCKRMFQQYRMRRRVEWPTAEFRR